MLLKFISTRYLGYIFLLLYLFKIITTRLWGVTRVFEKRLSKKIKKNSSLWSFFFSNLLERPGKTKRSVWTSQLGTILSAREKPSRGARLQGIHWATWGSSSHSIYCGTPTKDLVLNLQNVMVTLRFTWQGIWKRVGSILLGTSPEYEMALYTLCFLSRRGRELCPVSLIAKTRLNQNSLQPRGYSCNLLPAQASIELI